ncbi:class A beta-lactamase-related serine hydrolase [Aquimarina sp. AD1]|uniref:serine hydrolase domain-containing protein n=1 Tax=Aquimarina sp. (strain AD1) TaxID=1714848 RepID=UPI000E4B41E0|nr:serine hydrolase domain-containing protein [Aquimarina sp. AD1]AXT58258.1 class A beta-lactamase-related serine hydrolase [Aquimarina sp. AD1]RKN36063.1 class A beta-lactamase-related serine hydrolase [Aquimarina sp. AD1]
MKHSALSISIFIISSILFTVSCNTTNNNTSSTENKIDHIIEKKIDSLLKSLHQNRKFNGNILIAKNDQIIYKNEFGFSDGYKKNILKETDRFNIGSIYKEIPAIAIMQLEEKGLLQLNDPIKKHLSYLPDWSNNIKIINLLQYTSGLPKIDWRKHKIINDQNLINDLSEISNLEFTPGEDYIYTNFSPFLLSKIVESITDTTFSSYVNQNIIKPLHLEQSTFNTSFPYKNRDSMALPFNNKFEEDKLPFIIKSPIFLFSTTTNDLFQLIKNLHSGNIINKNSLLKISKTANLDRNNMQSALGNITYEKEKIIEHTHHGTSGNYESIISKNELNSTTIIILTNNKSGNIHALRNTIIELIKTNNEVK